MPIFRRVLTVSAVAAASVFAFALPASAHTGAFTRDCGEVTMTLTAFADGDNTVHVLRDGQQIDVVTFNGRSTSKTYPQSNEGTVTYKAVWYANETADGHRSSATSTLVAPEDCQPDTVPSATPPATPPPTETPPAMPTETPSPSVAPTSAMPTTPSVAPTTSAAAVQGSKLANTGAGNTVPLVIVGSVLVAGGVALTLVTRRRRSGGTSAS